MNSSQQNRFKIRKSAPGPHRLHLGQTKQAGLNLPNQRRLHRPHPKLCRIRLLSHKRPRKSRRNLFFWAILGVGKEADVYDALNSDGKRIAVKFHRLGRISFRQTRRKRGYTREHSTWLFQSHLAAEKEFQAMKLVYENGVSVPEPISHNRHVIAMGMIEGAQLSKYKDIGKPEKVLREILRNIRKTYLESASYPRLT